VTSGRKAFQEIAKIHGMPGQVAITAKIAIIAEQGASWRSATWLRNPSDAKIEMSVTK
jgi:hypothetical protein